MDFDEFFGGCKRKPAKNTLKGAARIYVYPDKIIAEVGARRKSKCEQGRFGVADVHAVEKETRRSGAKNGRPIFWFF